MCGIVGYGGFTKRVSLDRAVEAIKHRGPDDNGTQYFEDVALGNTRLSILDLSEKGHQPMFNKDRSLCITFNGEIYNFLEIKDLLDNKYQFKSNSDTEVILYAYQQWGFKCLEKLNGMFSFVIYDRKKRLLFGARDRLGQKPLKYFLKDNKLIFGSEIKAILPLLNFNPDFDAQAIDDFLTLQYVPAPKTGFKDIYKLPSGHYFIYKDKKMSIHKYWSLNFRRKLKLSSDEWENLVFNELERSVKSHLISDVPVGVLLSGGLDSSLIVALMAKNSSQKINTFSIGFDDKKFYESEFSSEVAKIYNTKHHKLIVKPSDLLKSFITIADNYDEPIGDNSILPSMLVSKLASSKVKVALTGDGGDENFAGYERYLFVNISNFISKISHTNSFVPKTLGALLKLYPHKQTERSYRFLTTLNEVFYRKYINYNLFFTNSVKQNLYSQSFKKLTASNDTYELYKKFYDKDLSDLVNVLKIDINTYLPDNLLYKTDTATMAFGLELRSPFLDHILMEKIAKMPSNMKLKLFTKKKILKSIAKWKNLLPQELINRPKKGFNIPQNKWFKGSLKTDLTNQILTSSMIGKIFEKNKLEDYLNDYFRNNLNYDNNIFSLLTLSLWFDKYF